jgi:2-polyprenyl-3-methyl-5-hydroxy-6-metoxy-1,4-benzoquinol methylase
MMRQALKRIAARVLFPTPPHVLANQIRIDADRLRVIERSLRENYHVGWRDESHTPREAHANDVQEHLYRRLESDRRTIVPWIDAATPLRAARVLEIGCGTGSSTVALAEQGARVTGVDIDEGALAVARDRFEACGLDGDLRLLNADELKNTFGTDAFDVIVFFACLEHMTIGERLVSLRDVWAMLPAGGLLVVVETPNRLWYFDDHTALLPFFHWLPDELAFQYSQFSPREEFRNLYHHYDAESALHFLRRGRGVSFHEFDLAIGPARDLKVISSLSTFQGLRYTARRSAMERRYKNFLRRICPSVHQGFCDNTLYLIIEKTST